MKPSLSTPQIDPAAVHARLAAAFAQVAPELSDTPGPCSHWAMRKYLEIAHIWQDGILPRRDEAILTDLYSQGFYKNTTRCDETLRRDLFDEAESLKENYDTVNDVIRLSPKLLERLLNEPVVREMLLTLNNTWGTYAIQDVHYHYRYSFEETGSGFWHRDGGGHKYKFFLILDQIGETTKTALLPTSHFLLGPICRWENVHTSMQSSWLPNPVYQKLVESPLQEAFGPARLISGEPGQSYMIDTNAIHRGSDHHASEGARRLVVLIELVERRTKTSYYEVFNQRLESHPIQLG